MLIHHELIPTKHHLTAMNSLFDTLIFSLSITTPIFVVLALGIFLNYRRLINDNFIDIGSRIVFNISLPVMLFISISQTSIEQFSKLSLIGVGLGCTLIAWILMEIFASRIVEPSGDRGVVIQGSFRANLGIIGLAYCVNAYGEAGLVAASLYLGLMTIVFNVLSVITLNRSLHTALSLKQTLKNIAKNPLIMGIVLALPFSAWSIELPALVIKTGGYLSGLTLPLALICTGASLDFNALRNSFGNALIASVSKLIFVPSIMILAGLWLGFEGLDLGILVLMASAPTSSVSYIMVRTIGGNAPLAANIIAITTLGSLVTTSVFITFLKSFGYL